MLSDEKLNKYCDLVFQYVSKYRKDYNLKGNILLSIGDDLDHFGEKLVLSFNKGNSHTDYIKFFPQKDYSYLNEAGALRQNKFLNSITVDLLNKYDTIVKIGSANQNINEKILSKEFNFLRQKKLRLYLDRLEKHEEDKKLLYFRSYLFNHNSEKFYNQNIEILDKTLSDALFLDFDNPYEEIEKRRKRLKQLSSRINYLKIDSLNLSGKNININLKLGTGSRWIYSGLKNFPSYEIFTCPLKYSCTGEITFNNSVFYNNVEISEIFLKFYNGKVVEYKAKSGLAELQKILSFKGGNYIGEIGITDKSLSPIRNISRCTMFDENVSGNFGNFHLALGNSYSRCHIKTGVKEVYNKSDIHTDFVNTEEFTIEATLENNKKITLFHEGEFKI